jgi:hypothetical protein
VRQCLSEAYEESFITFGVGLRTYIHLLCRNPRVQRAKCRTRPPSLNEPQFSLPRPARNCRTGLGISGLSDMALFSGRSVAACACFLFVHLPVGLSFSLVRRHFSVQCPLDFPLFSVSLSRLCGASLCVCVAGCLRGQVYRSRPRRVFRRRGGLLQFRWPSRYITCFIAATLGATQKAL